MIIAFFGPSSSGKSTLIKKIRKSAYFKGKKIVVKKEDDFFIINALKKLLGERWFSKYKDVKFYRKKGDAKTKGFSLFVQLFYPLIVYLDFLFDHVYYEFIFKSKVLIKDQYIYAYIITFKKVLKIDIPFYEFLYKRFPRPYLSFFIRIKKDTSVARNKNPTRYHIASTGKFHEMVLSSYNKIAKYTKALIVDSDSGLEGSVKEIEEHILAKDNLIKVKTISLSGLDGSGKTTTATLLGDYSEQLNISYKIVSFYYQNLVFKLFKSLGIWDTKSKGGFQKRGKGYLWTIPTLLDSYIQHFFSTTFFRRRLIIFDRFFYDYLVSFEYFGVKNTAFLKQIMPKIDRRFLLWCKPQVCFKRSKESSLSYLTECAEIYKRVAKQYNMVKITTDSKSSQRVLKELVSKL